MERKKAHQSQVTSALAGLYYWTSRRILSKHDIALESLRGSLQQQSIFNYAIPTNGQNHV
jgi:hypothetical protein